MTLTKYSETDAVAYGGPRRFLHMGDLGLELFLILTKSTLKPTRLHMGDTGGFCIWGAQENSSETDVVAYGRREGKCLHMGDTEKLL